MDVAFGDRPDLLSPAGQTKTTLVLSLRYAALFTGHVLAHTVKFLFVSPVRFLSWYLQVSVEIELSTPSALTVKQHKLPGHPLHDW